MHFWESISYFPLLVFSVIGVCNAAGGCDVNNPCSRNANCTELQNDVGCICKDGYRGDGYECSNVNECDRKPCHKFASCRDTEGSYKCTCHKGYMGNGHHCEEMWLLNSRCGVANRLPNGRAAQCNPKSLTPCCSAHGYCGDSTEHCECPMCHDYRKGCVYHDMDITTRTLREVTDFSSWRDCEALCKREKECVAWVWRIETFPGQSSRKICTLKHGKGDKKDIDMDKDKVMRIGFISGLKHCPDSQKRSYRGYMRRNGTQSRINTCSRPGICRGNICIRGTTGAELKIGNNLTSDNGIYNATMQRDGNFVIYCGSKAIWSTRTDGNNVFEGLKFQKDGNLVIYTFSNGNMEPIWSSGTYRTEADHLILQDNGNLVLYGYYGERILWESQSYDNDEC